MGKLEGGEIKNSGTREVVEENTGNVISKFFAGGIVGCTGNTGGDKKMDTRLAGLTNKGYVEAKSEKAGGIVGEADGVVIKTYIENCHSVGSFVKTKERGGGIVGNMLGNATITECTNSGDVGGLFYIDGICGYKEETATVSNCTNAGNIIKE